MGTNRWTLEKTCDPDQWGVGLDWRRFRFAGGGWVTHIQFLCFAVWFGKY